MRDSSTFGTMKRVFYAVLLIAVVASWMWFFGQGREIGMLRQEIAQLYEQGDPDEKIPGLEEKLSSLEGERTFSGVLLTFVSAGIVGIFIAVYLLPLFAQRVTHMAYDSGEMIEKDVMSEARSLMAQGDYEGAIEACRRAAASDPLNRLPWIEIAKIYVNNLDDPASAIETIRRAQESQDWQVDDAAFFLFRLAEIHDEHEGDRTLARAILQQVIDDYPNTRHSANARHKLHEWDLQDGKAAVAKPGAEFPARRTGGTSGDPGQNS